MYILETHQKQGWGLLCVEAIVNWYKENIALITHQPLRVLAKADNIVVTERAARMGFNPLLDDKGAQLITTQEGLSYLVFQRDF